MTLPWHLPVVIGSPPAGVSLTLTAGTPSVLITTGFTVTPASATLHLTGATPDVAVTANVVVTPDGVTLTLSGGTPGVITPRAPITPAGARLHLVGGTPSVALGLIYDSYRIAALSLADYVQPLYSGTGARLSRHASGASANQPSTVAGTPAPLVGNTFDSIDICTADITVSLAASTLIVATPGWYHIESRLTTNSAYGFGGAGQSCIYNMVLYKNGTPVRLGQDCIGPSDTALHSVWGAFDVDVAAGDVVGLGVNVQSSTLGTWGVSGAFPGFPAGAVSYMTITLQNRAA